jgi:quercetin dioxygenase-like cupin family protein
MSRSFPAAADFGRHVIFGSTHVTTYAGDNVQLSIADIPANAVVDWHTHPNEQLGYVVSGEATFSIGEEVKRLRPGDVFFIPGGVRHKVAAHDKPFRAIDVFYPIRDEYR